MAIDQRTHPALSSGTHSVRRRPPLWGHLSRAVSRYGVVSSVLVIYPPDSSEQERRIAEAARCAPPIALGGGTVLWIALMACGVPPLLAALLVLAVAVPVVVVLGRRSRAVRRRAAVVHSCCSALRADDADRAQQHRLDALADAVQGAGASYRAGRIDERAFRAVWTAAFEHAREG